MYEVARRSAAFAAATGGLLLVGVGYASADSIVQVTAGGGAPSATVTSSSPETTTDRAGGVLSGNTVAVPLNIPVDLCDIAALGASGGSAACAPDGISSATEAFGPLAAEGERSGIAGGVLSGNTVAVPLNIPVDLCDIAALGISTGAQSCSAGRSPYGSADATSSAVGVLSGNVVQLPANVPLTIHDGAFGASTGADADADAAADAAATATADAGPCSCSVDGSLADGYSAGTGEASAYSDALWADELQMQSHSAASTAPAAGELKMPAPSAASATLSADGPQTPPAFTMTLDSAKQPYVANSAPASLETIVKAAGSTTATSSSSQSVYSSTNVPRQRPASATKGTLVVGRVKLPAGASTGRLAETGSGSTLPLCAGGAAALASGAGLSAHAAKGKATAERY